MSIDGDAGLVIRRRVRLGEPPSASSGNLARVLGWADERKALGVLANADSGKDAAAARDAARRVSARAHRAHVFRHAGASEGGAAHDSGDRRHDVAVRAERDRSFPGTRLLGDLQGDGRVTRRGSTARPAAARVPASSVRDTRARRRARQGPGPGRRQGSPRGRREARHRGTRCVSAGSEPDARQTRVPPRDRVPDVTKDAGARHLRGRPGSRVRRASSSART